MTDLPACRAAFEKWWLANEFENSMECAWLGWQAAWNTPTPSVDVETLKALVERWRKAAHDWRVSGFDARSEACKLHADELAAVLKRGEVGNG